MKRAILCAAGVLLAARALTMRRRRSRVRGAEIDNGVQTSPIAATAGELGADPDDRGVDLDEGHPDEVAADPFESLAAVERAAAASAIAGTPSSIPALPSIPGLKRQARQGSPRSRSSSAGRA